MPFLVPYFPGLHGKPRRDDQRTLRIVAYGFAVAVSLTLSRNGKAELSKVNSCAQPTLVRSAAWGFGLLRLEWLLLQVWQRTFADAAKVRFPPDLHVLPRREGHKTWVRSGLGPAIRLVAPKLARPRFARRTAANPV